MSELFEEVLAAPDEVRIAFLQGLFEKSGIVDGGTRAVWVSVQASYLNQLMRLLKEVGASPHVVGTQPVTVAVDVREAARIPLFNPDLKSKKYLEMKSLAAAAPLE
jgi:hypothetical protein